MSTKKLNEERTQLAGEVAEYRERLSALQEDVKIAFARPAGALLPAQIQIFAQQFRQGGFLRPGRSTPT